MRVHLQNGQVKFVYKGQRVNVKVTGTTSVIAITSMPSLQTFRRALKTEQGGYSLKFVRPLLVARPNLRSKRYSRKESQLRLLAKSIVKPRHTWRCRRWSKVVVNRFDRRPFCCFFCTLLCFYSLKLEQVASQVLMRILRHLICHSHIVNNWSAQ